jgi:hypothetical protein
MPKEKFNSIEDGIIKYSEILFKNTSNETIEETKKLAKKISQIREKSTFVSCWHRNTELSQLMWEDYAKKEVYIKTSEFDLINSFPPELLCIFKQNSVNGNIIHQVEYIDRDEINTTTARETIINGDEHKFKGLEYIDENESRLIIEESILKLRTRVLGDESLSIHNEFLVDYNQNDISTHRENDNVVGVYIRVNPTTLINEIGVGSEEIKKSVIGICERYDISPTIKIIES